MKKIKDALGKPSRKSGPWAMWIWNKQISKPELVSQLDSFITNGFAGVAIRPSRDMNPAYMSEEFLDYFNLILEKAKSAGMGIRLADDFALPFNDFFESVARKSSSYRARQLVLMQAEMIPSKTDFTKSGINTDTDIVLAAKILNDRLIPDTVKILSIHPENNGSVSWKGIEGDWQIMFFRKTFVTDPDGHFIPNVFSSLAVQTYCSDILDRVWPHFSKFAPATFEGFVTEIPAYLPAENAIPWDEDLPVKFKSRFRKDLIKLLPSLFFEVDDASVSIRTDFYTFMAGLMYERFAGTLETWVKKHRVTQWVLTPEKNVLKQSHLLRDCLAFAPNQLSCTGVQAHEGTNENFQSIRAAADANTVQFRRSTVAIAGRNQYGAGSSIQSLKTEIDTHAINGASHVLLDGCFFNLDHRNNIRTPFNPFWYSPCSKQLENLTSYAARLSSLLFGVQFSRPAAILMPSSSLLADYLPGNGENLKRGLGLIQKTIDELHHLNVAFDIITEDFFTSCQVRTNGEFGTANRIRKGGYQALIVPYSRLVKRSVLAQFEKLAAAKGTLIFTGEAPQGTLEDGVTSSLTSRIEKLVSPKKNNVRVIPPKEMGPFTKHIDSPVKVTLTGKRCPEIYASSGTGQGFDVHILHNTADRRDFFVNVQVPAAPHIYIADCRHGELIELKTVTRTDKCVSFDLSFAPKATYAIITSSVSVPSSGGKHSVVPKSSLLARSYRVVLKEQWSFTPDSLNVLPLANWSTRIGLSRESGGYSHYSESYFEVRELPDICVFALCGSLSGNSAGKTLEVSVNGTIVDAFIAAVTPDANPSVAAQIEQFCGAGIPKYDIKNHLVKGFNRIAIRTVSPAGDPQVVQYPPFVAGNFAIAKGARGWAIDKPQCTVGYDSWTKYGFPYMSGSGTYRQDFELPADYQRIVMKFSLTSGPISVSLNQKPAGTFIWQPMELDITDLCEHRRNTLEVKVMNTMDNILRLNSRPSGLTGEVFLDVY